jgi:hypothetical protein
VPFRADENPQVQTPDLSYSLVSTILFELKMTTAGSFDAPIEIFGGLVTDMSPADLPHGVSPDCQDVIYSNGGVATRPGLQSLFGPLAGNPT